MNDAVTETKEETVETPVDSKVEEAPSRDELLKEFDEGMQTEEPASTNDLPGDDRVDQTFEFMQQERARRAQADVSKAVETIKSYDESLGVYDNDMLEGWLDKQARKDPRLMQAWNSRYDQPDKWNQILTTFARDLAEKTTAKPETKITDDMQSVRSAIKTSDTKSDGPSADEIVNMSDGDFAELKKSLGFDSSDW